MITFKIIIFQSNILEIRCFCSRCVCMEMVVGVIYWNGCLQTTTSKRLGSCLIMSSTWRIGWHSLAICMIHSTIRWLRLSYVTCNLRTRRPSASCGGIKQGDGQRMVFPIQTSRDSWSTMFKPIVMQFELSMVTKIEVK
jgi:hypothetical protein